MPKLVTEDHCSSRTQMVICFIEQTPELRIYTEDRKEIPGPNPAFETSRFLYACKIKIRGMRRCHTNKGLCAFLPIDEVGIGGFQSQTISSSLRHQHQPV